MSNIDKEKYKTKIFDYGYDGEGVGEIGGKVCFIPYTIKDEEVKFELTKDNKSFAQGKLTDVLEKSEKRIEPKCPYFGVCGGCSYQHMPYSEELKIKEILLKRQLKKAGFKGDVSGISSPEELRYRNKLKLFVGDGKVGLKVRSSNKICPIEDCLLVQDKISKAIVPISNFVKGNNLYKFMDTITLRQEEDNCLINFSLKVDKDINYQGLYLLLGKDYGIFQTFRDETKHILGLDKLVKEEYGLNLKFSPLSFHQVNSKVQNLLYDCVLSKTIGDSVINAYSGSGLLSGILAKRFGRVTGVELGEAEHNEAQELKEENELYNLINIKGDCAKILPRLEGDTLIVDPPRGGLQKEVCQVISQKNFKRVIYISCNSATLVRDLQLLQGYKIDKAYLFDMFARTGEYECLVVLSRK